MAGHSKWANTKHRKATQDAKRDKIFTKIIRELVTATRLGGSDTTSNPRLRAAIDKALSNNMTRETLNRAIERGVGSNENYNMKTMTYEGYGPGGAAIIIQCLSNNRNRTASDMRYAFAKYGGHLGATGSVSYLFTKYGVISYAHSSDVNSLIETAIEVGAEDFKFYADSSIDIYTTVETFNDIKNALEAIYLQASTASLMMIPLKKVNLDYETTPKLLHLIDMLEEFDDVQIVYHNGIV